MSGERALPQEFELIEATISDIHRAVLAGKVTCHALVEGYLERIHAYDRATQLNAIVVTNPNALAEADELDEEFRRTGKLRPLHGIPVIVKDNYDTKDIQTTGGSLALKGSIPPDDAYQVRKLREAGAIVLAKSNMAEWAFSPYVTVSSILGITRNPYDLERVPAGSSGGTAAAVAANFGAVGLGTDTGNSIRGPSSHTCLVGIRSTMGLTSRDGIIPVYLRNDIGGPMARTLEDAVRILEVIAGYDPADPITKVCEGKVPENYTQFLDRDGLEGACIGVFRKYIDTPMGDSQVKALTEKAIKDLKTLGAEIVDPFAIPDFDELTENIWCDVFQHDVNHYLASLGENAPYKNLAEIVESGLYSPYIEDRLKRELEVDTPPEERDPPCLDLYRDPRNIAFREAILEAMEKNRVGAIVYPTWSNPPRKVGDTESPAGDNSQYMSPQTGFPAITVPMGFTYHNLPAGLTFVGRLFSEPDLIRFVYAYEQATSHRRPPEKFC
jgi:Asp-tRNA(Asn)/Glu-tRNA(Gln) amidotransferase A subunit family amidase